MRQVLTHLCSHIPVYLCAYMFFSPYLRMYIYVLLNDISVMWILFITLRHSNVTELGRVRDGVLSYHMSISLSWLELELFILVLMSDTSLRPTVPIMLNFIRNILS